MNVPTRLAAFAAVLGLAFGGAALAGAAIDPTDEQDVVAEAGHGEDEATPGPPTPTVAARPLLAPPPTTGRTVPRPPAPRH